jgi:hypothetical protein
VCSRVTLIAISLLCASCANGGEAPSSAPAGGTTANSAPSATASAAADVTLQRIDQAFADVTRRRSALRVVKRDLDGLSTEGGEFTAYLENDAVRLADVVFSGETGKTELTMLYDDSGGLRFAVRTESRYDRPFGDIESRHTSRYYFDQGQLLKALNDSREAGPNSDARAQAARLIELARQIADDARVP